MGSEDFFILGDGKVQNAEEELVLSSLIDKKSEETETTETVISNVEVENVLPEDNQGVSEDEDVKQTSEGTEADNVDVVEEIEESGETTVQDVDQLISEFQKFKSNEDCNSILKTHLTDETFEKLKNINGDDGAVLYDCIKSGLENHDSVLGIYATDLQLYDQFSDIFDPVLETYHGFGKENVQPNSDWGDSQIFQPFNGNGECVVSIRMNCMRNIQDYPVVSKMEEKDLNDSLAKVKSFFSQQQRINWKFWF